MTQPAACILGCAGPRLTAAERGFFAAAQPWGFILFARNVEDPAQLRALTAELRACVGRAAPILIDQEGGRVQRLTRPHWRKWYPALEQMARTPEPDRAVRAMYLRYRLIAQELHGVGIDTNCAPLADLVRPETHPILRNRCYGDTVATVIAVARAVAEGLLAGGVLPVLKHIPGHGRATRDSHVDLPRVTTPRATLEAEDFAAFRGLSDLPLGMTAHIVFADIDPAQPATASAPMIRLIRDSIGFDGVLMTDDLSMQALTGSIADRSAAAIAAGCDLVLHCNGQPEDMAQVIATCGLLTPGAQTRADRALARRTAPEPIDIAAREDELVDLLGGEVYG